MTARDVPVHYLRGNAKVWTPGHLCVIDTETSTREVEGGEVLAMSLWCARLVDRRPGRRPRASDESAAGSSGDDLARQVDQWSRGRSHLWVYAHNLAFDLTTTRLPLRLVKLGWTLGDFSVASDYPWFRLRKGNRGMVITDSFSVFPRSVAEIGRIVGIRKPDAPLHDPDDALWAERCRADVDIVMAALCQAMDWWGNHQLGQWSLTGPATGWHAARHVESRQKILINPDAEGVAHDRQAAYGGRRHAGRVGQHRMGPFLELDFQAAYPTVAAYLGLPSGRGRHFDALPLHTRLLDDVPYGIVAEVELDTDTPRWPVRLAGRTWYPVGRFKTTLAGPDIREARDTGCLKAIGPGYVHHLNAALQPWARWVLSVKHAAPGAVPETVRVMAGQWSTSVLGRFAARGTEQIELGPAPTTGWGYEPCRDLEYGTLGAIVDMAGRRYLSRRTGATDDSYPAIYAWVESEVRVRLGRVIDAVGPNAVMQANTDGLIVAQRLLGTPAAGGTLRAPDGLRNAGRVAWCLQTLNTLCAPLTLRIKARHAGIDILGPQSYELPGERRLSGLPRQAELLTDRELSRLDPKRREKFLADRAAGRAVYKVTTWPKLPAQLEADNPAGYVRKRIYPVMGTPAVSGWVLDTGRVLPVEMDIGTRGQNIIVDWHRSGVAKRPGDMLGPYQIPPLEGLH